MTAPRDKQGARAAKADAATRAAKGSVQEAIGKLIGDDAAEARGKAEKTAGASATPDSSTSRP